MLTMLVAAIRKQEDSQPGLCASSRPARVHRDPVSKQNKNNKQTKKENLKTNCLQPTKNSHSRA